MLYQKKILMTFIFLFVFISCGLSEMTLNANEVLGGSPCIWQEQRGLCVSIYQCLSAAIDVKNGNPPPTCSTAENKPPVVCCTDCSLVKDIRNFIFDKRLGIFEKSKIKSDYYCIKMLHELDSPCKKRTEVSIYKTVADHDGENCNTMRRLTKQRKNFYAPYAWKEDLIHLTMLGYGIVEVGLQWLCGGSLISDRFVLTAAYCVDYVDVGRVKQIGVGEHQGSYEHWHQYRVIRAITHPKYKPPSMYHDIALLKTEMPVLFRFWVMPACLPHNDDLLNTTAMGTAIGNYSSEKNSLVGSYFVQLEKFSVKDCKILYPPSSTLLNGFDATTQICYGYKNRKDMPCGTDRGAPLQRKHAKYPCGVSIIGVTSFERRCKYKVGFGLYTNVSYYSSWIESVVWPDKLV